MIKSGGFLSQEAKETKCFRKLLWQACGSQVCREAEMGVTLSRLHQSGKKRQEDPCVRCKPISLWLPPVPLTRFFLRPPSLYPSPSHLPLSALSFLTSFSLLSPCLSLSFSSPFLLLDFVSSSPPSLPSPLPSPHSVFPSFLSLSPSLSDSLFLSLPA